MVKVDGDGSGGGGRWGRSVLGSLWNFGGYMVMRRIFSPSGPPFIPFLSPFRPAYQDGQSRAVSYVSIPALLTMPILASRILRPVSG